MTGAAAAALGLDPRRCYRQVVAVVGMGNVNATDVAEEVHLNALRLGFPELDSHLMVYGEPMPDSHLLIGVYLDDLAIIGQVPRSLGLAKPAADSVATSQLMDGLEEAGLERSPEKGFGFAKEV